MSKRVKFALFALIVAGATSTILTNVYGAGRRAASAACTISIENVFRAQDGTILRTETYQKDFIVEEGTNFVDDYSTPTRQKRFTAALQRNGRDAVVSINWFADVSTFDAVDVSTGLFLDGGKPGQTSARQTFSSTPGHNTTTYTLTAVQN